LDIKIPKSFWLLGNKINVEYNENLIMDGTLGKSYLDENRIELLTTIGRIVRTPESVKQTYLHELVHLIFYHSGYKDLTLDEKLVEMFAQLLYQAFVTYEGEDEMSNAAENGFSLVDNIPLYIKMDDLTVESKKKALLEFINNGNDEDVTSFFDTFVNLEKTQVENDKPEGEVKNGTN
jgi:hypothetical protein